MATISTMTFEEYKNIEHSVPYVLHLKDKSGAELLYYGARHSYDPSDPMFDEMTARFQVFQPKIAFVEGGVVPTVADRNEMIRQDGERGFLCFLCHLHSVPVGNLEPPFDKELKYLLTLYTQEQLFLFYCVRQILQYRHMQSRPSFEEYMGSFAEGMAQRLNLKVATAVLPFLHTLYQQVFDQELVWEAMTDEVVHPFVYKSITNEIARQNSYFRDASHVTKLFEAMQAHNRVFAVVGASHVVMQEPLLRQIFTA